MLGKWLNVHYDEKGYDIWVKDVEEYSFMCLLQDLEEQAYKQNVIPARNPIIRFHPLGLNKLEEVKCDVELVKMFRSLSRKKEIDIFVENAENASNAIRRSCMVIGTRQAQSENWNNDDVTPYAKEQVRKNSEEARGCQLFVSGKGQYEVVEGKTAFPINLVNQTCMCGKWQITGIPCKHALRVLNNNRINPHSYVCEYYSLAKYKQANELTIHPMPDSSLWPPRDPLHINPPQVKRTIGRPPRNRRRERGEQQKGKRSVTVKCNKCGNLSHNKRACMGGMTSSQKKVAGVKQHKKRGREEGLSSQHGVDVPTGSKKKGKKPTQAT
ncbi:hypothetical protein RDABS01_007191 [Bienertia sinuspersici]